MHRALSSALLLGILGEHIRNERARRLISRFIAVLGDIANGVDPEEISAPVQRGLAALGRLKIQEPSNGYVGDGSFVHNSGILMEQDGLPKLDHSALITPAHSDHGSLPPSEDHSPHQVLNQILWGDTDYHHHEL